MLLDRRSECVLVHAAGGKLKPTAARRRPREGLEEATIARHFRNNTLARSWSPTVPSSADARSWVSRRATGHDQRLLDPVQLL